MQVKDTISDRLRQYPNLRYRRNAVLFPGICHAYRKFAFLCAFVAALAIEMKYSELKKADLNSSNRGSNFPQISLPVLFVVLSLILAVGFRHT